MKNILIKKIISMVIVAAGLITVLSACEQDGVTPKLDAAPGGGTLSSYKAYTLDSIVGKKNVYGRIVFWKDNASNTLVQISLYNTTSDSAYPTGIYVGTVGGGSTAELMSLYSIDGATGEFSTSKFYVIGDKNFYSGLDDMDAHIKIFSSSVLVASGDVGSNADPVAESD